MKRVALSLIACLACLALMGCGRKAVAVAPPPTISADELYRRGLEAFAQATPEGYLRASNAFRQAYLMAPARCEFPLHLAQSLLFLAEEQLLNREDYGSGLNEAREVVEKVRMSCAASEAFLLRLDSLILGRSNATTAMMKRATELDPADPMNWHVYSKVEIVDRAAMIQRAADLGRDSALHLFTSAAWQANRGNRNQATRNLLRRVIELSPRHFRAHLELAYALSGDDAVDEVAQVEPLFRKVVEIAPKFLEGRLAMGSYLAGIDEIDAAAAEYYAAIAANPRYDVAYFSIGLLMLQAERSREAEEAFLKVLELNTTQGEAFYYLGILALNRDEIDTAKNRFQQALNIRSNYAAAEYGLGRVLQRELDVDGALNRFDRAIRFAPSYADAYLSRATIRADRRQTADAVSDLDRSIQLFDQQIAVADTAIEYAKAHPQSRAAQATARRSERDKQRIQIARQGAATFKADLERAR
jgi:tetratricopeptide (TPR) repeat protein